MAKDNGKGYWQMVDGFCEKWLKHCSDCSTRKGESYKFGKNPTCKACTKLD